MNLDTEEVIELILLGLILVTTVTTNFITLFVISWTDYLRNINRIYLYSVTISDLCIGLTIFPFALYCSVINKFGYPGINDRLCHLQAYMTVVFFLSGLYAVAWMNVDHYVAVRKPERYKVMMSPPRSLCWIVFAWIAAISFCCPPLLSFQDTIYYRQVYVCTIYIGSETPYFITAGALALMPAFTSLLVTNVYLFSHAFRKKQKVYENVMLDSSSRPRNYQLSFLVSVIFIGTWMPWCVLRISSFYEESIPQQLHFYTFWLAMGNSYYKFFVYAGMSIEYRRGLRELFTHCLKCLPCGCCTQTNPSTQGTGSSAVPTRIVTKPSTSGAPPTSV